MGAGDSRIVCAAVAKSEMNFEFKEEMQRKKQTKGGSGGMSRPGLTPLHSLLSFPTSPSSAGLGSDGGGADKF